jgi:hypothetical protein
MGYEIKTSGEALAMYIESHLIRRSAWAPVEGVLDCTGRGAAWCEFFHEVTVMNLSCRIVAAGTSLLGASGTRLARSAEDVGFQWELREFIRDRLCVNQARVGEVMRLAIEAVKAAAKGPTVRERDRFKQWARREHPNCYMCGTALDFTGEDPYSCYTLEHIWPQRFGGDSIDENFLPACGKCNSHRKKDFVTWAMPSVQSLILGFDPSEQERSRVEGVHRFALHQRAARKLAVQRKLTLKLAYVRLGPWESTLRLEDDEDLGDFFNLANHRVIDDIRR